MAVPVLVAGRDPAGIQIQVLGGFAVTIEGRRLTAGDWRSQKAQHLVKLLALSPTLSLERDEIIEALWPGSDPDAVADTCYQTIYYARRTIDPGRQGLLVTRRGRVSLRHPEGVSIDLVAFQSAAAAARQSHDPAAHAAALALYRGELLPENRYEDWASGPREIAQRLALDLLLGLARLQEDRREWAAAIATLGLLLASDAAHEEAHVALMRVYARAGRRRQAVAQFQRLRDALREFDAPPDAASQRLYAAILSGHFPVEDDEARPPGGRAAPDVASRRRRHNLPAPLTAILGREEAIATLRQLLSEARLVTLTGAGGTGKTRLGLAVAHEIVGTFPDGVWLVELAGIGDGALVPAAFLRAVGAGDRPDTPPLALLAEHLRARAALLVCDNCEQVLAACAQVATALLQSCPEIRILATSRAPLRVAGEVAWRVPSLPLPAPLAGPVTAARVAEVGASPAVQLFVARARQLAAGFAPTAGNLADLVTICRRLEGLPLALELAAVWVPVLALDQLAARLDRALHLLVGGDRSAPTRHQTLRATLDWGYDLLAADARALLCRLAVFVGGWSLAAAEAVAGEGEGAGAAAGDLAGDEVPVARAPLAAILPTLAHLVEHSFVVVEATEDGLRYRLLEPVRQYAIERLAASDGAAHWRERHARFYLALAERAAPELLGPAQAEVLARLGLEAENLRAALGWWADRGEAESGLRLAGALIRFWRTGNRTREGRAWLVEAFAAHAADVSPATRARALNGAALLAVPLNDFGRARAEAGEALVLCRAVGDSDGECDALDRLGVIAQRQGDLRAAETYFAAFRDLAARVGNERRLVTAMGNLAALHYYRGDLATAEREFAAQLDRARALADPTILRVVLLNLALARLGQGKTAGVRDLLAEEAGLCAAAQDWAILAFALIALALLANQERRAARAASLLGASAAIRALADLPIPPFQATFFERAAAEARQALGDGEFAAAVAAGRAWGVEQTLAMATAPPPEDGHR